MKKLLTLLLFAFSMLVIGSAFETVEKFKGDDARTEKVETVKIQLVDVLNETVTYVSVPDRTEDLELTITESKADLPLTESKVGVFTLFKPATDAPDHSDVCNRVIHEDPGR